MFSELGELAVFRAEIVTPFGNAVSLIDGDAFDVPAFQISDEAGSHDPLGGGIEEFVFAVGKGFRAVAGFGGVEGGVEERGGDAGGGERIDLIFHQGDEGRDDKGDPIFREGGKLEGQGFSRAGGENGDDILSGHGGGDDFTLKGAERIVAEILLQEGGELVMHFRSVGKIFRVTSKKVLL